MPEGFFSLPTFGDAPGDRPGLPKCGQCGLLKKCISPQMPVAGKGRLKILVVGEAPGEEEDRQGRPFIGESGRLLRDCLSRAGVDLDRDCWTTNSIICRPPLNKIEDVYIDSCRPALLATIEKLEPKVILLVGGSAARTLIMQEWRRDWGSLGKWIGWTIPSARFNAWLSVTYHPSFVLRTGENPVLVRAMEDHAVALMKKLDEPVFKMPQVEREVTPVTSEKEALRRLIKLAGTQKRGELAFDYETNCLKPEQPKSQILCCAYCLDGEDTWAAEMTPKLLRVHNEVMQNEQLRKIAANKKFEERWTIAKCGHRVRKWLWDTMLAAHVLDNRTGITSLKFLVYVYFGQVGYNRYMEAEDNAADMDINERLVYCGLDAYFTYRVAQVQREQMNELQELWDRDREARENARRGSGRNGGGFRSRDRSIDAGRYVSASVRARHGGRRRA